MALATCPAQPTYWRLTPTVWSPFLLLPGLVQHRDRAHPVPAASFGDGEVFDHEVPHHAHRGMGIP
jgi:hypothetical protein